MEAPFAQILTGLAVWAAAALLAFLGNKKIQDKVFSYLLLAGALLAGWGAFASLQSDCRWQAGAPIYLGVAPLANRIDALSATFLALLAVATAAISLFTPRYFGSQAHVNKSVYWGCKFLFVIGMAEVLMAANAPTFLLFWEVMSLSSLGLVAGDHSQKGVQKAAVIYLGATRIATSLIAAGFLFAYYLTKSWSFSDWHLTSHLALVPSMLLLIGFAVKAGIWPFHIWLPYAHPAAPAPVSALMSGVMLKVSLYGIMRLLASGGGSSDVVPIVALSLGIVSSFWGVLFALAQQDLKRLLAYSSIENVGLILTATAIGMYCKAHGYLELGALAMAAGIFHAINHGIFKSLLFLGAGALDRLVGSRNLSALGGLTKSLPRTTICFLIGSVAICALPPLNGFASKWLLYQSFFGLAWQSQSILTRSVAAGAIGVLSLVGGLSIALFSQAVGITFLGQPRSHQAERAAEKPDGMLAAQFLLALCCILAGVFAPQMLLLIEPACQVLIGKPVHLAGSFPLPLGVLLVTLAGTFAIVWLAFLSRRQAARRYITWDCGFGELSNRCEATSISFVHSIEYVFRHLLQYRTTSLITGKDKRHFPERITAEASTASLLEMHVYAPAIAFMERIGRRLAQLQAGSIHLYLLYMLLTLTVLLAVGAQL